MEMKTVLAPVPGVFYRKPSPDEDVFVQDGDMVKAGDTIGLVEVMKMFYELKTEWDGVLKTFSVENEDVVEADQEIALIQIKE